MVLAGAHAVIASDVVKKLSFKEKRTKETEIPINYQKLKKLVNVANIFKICLYLNGFILNFA